MGTKRDFYNVGLRVLFFILCLSFFSTSAMKNKGFARGAEISTPPQQTGLISMDFKDAEIGNVLRLLAEQNNLNIIVARDVKGLVTVRFTNVALEEALNAIITVNGFAFSKVGSVIKVTSKEAAEKEPALTRIFVLNNADAKELKTSLSKMISKTGSIEADSRSNSLIVTDVPHNIENIEGMLKKLDGETPQVLIEAKIIETILGDEDKLGIDWTIQATAKGAIKPIQQPFDSATWHERFPAYKPPPGVSPPTWELPTPEYIGNTFTFGTLDFSSFQQILELLESRKDTNVLSNPKIATLDNQKARITVGTSIPIATWERNETTGKMEITGYEKEEVGITLTVTPHVTSSGFIRMDVHPEISSITGWTGAPPDERPITSTREAETQVQIRDGETIVIGGLIKEEEVNSVRRVPLLGHIPILGFFFKKTEKTMDKTDLIIFITANIMTDRVTEELTQKEQLRIGVKDKGRPAKK